MTLFNCNRSCQAMGTRFEVRLRGDDGEHLDAVAAAVVEEIIRLDGVLSRFDPRSEVARVNREATHRPVRLDREVFGLLERCEQARQFTAGYFDVTVSHRGTGETPALRLDAQSRTVLLARPGSVIDLGGIGKGYALDRARDILLRFGVTCGLLDGGTSSVLALGAPPGRAGWPVTVRHPLAPDAAPVASVELADRAFSCSAVRHPGQPRSDVVDPLTGQPLGGDAVCVVLAASAAEAEVLSTALLAMGRERRAQFLAQRSDPGVSVGWFEPDAGFAWVW